MTKYEHYSILISIYVRLCYLFYRKVTHPSFVEAYMSHLFFATFWGRGVANVIHCVTAVSTCQYLLSFVFCLLASIFCYTVYNPSF